METTARSLDYLPQLSSSTVLEARNEPGLAMQFLQSAAYSGLESPARALAQAADHFSGSNLDKGVENAFKNLGVEAPQASEFGSGSWCAQQLGGAVGMMLPFLALRAGINYAGQRISGAFGTAAATAAFESANQSLLRYAAKEAALSGAAGLLYGSLLSPSDEKNVGTNSFYSDRLKSGLSTMAAFSTLSFAGPYMGQAFESLASIAERSALPQIAGRSLAASLRSPVLAGVASGIPAGFVNAEAHALKELRFASSQEIKESMVSMAFIGGTLALASKALERKFENREGNEKLNEMKRESFEKELVRSGFDGKNGRALSEIEQLEMIERAIKKIEQSQNEARLPQKQEKLLDRLAESTVKKQEIAAAKSGELEAGGGKSAPRAISRENLKAKDAELPGLDIVLGASGIEAPAHAGFLKAIEDRGVPVRTITGVSGGSLVAALYANKYSPTQIKDILLSNEFRYPRADVLARAFHLADPWNLYPYSVDFRPWLQDFVDTYKLKPQANLRIVAADKITRAPVVFEGTNYNLVDALTASTAATVGLNMKPQLYNGRELIDGFYYHPTPADLAKAPAIVSKIGFVRQLPSGPLMPWDYFMHMREMSYYNTFKNRYPDPRGHIISETGLPDVATTTFSVSLATLKKLVDHGYESTIKRLEQPDAIKAIENAQKAAGSSQNN